MAFASFNDEEEGQGRLEHFGTQASVLYQTLISEAYPSLQPRCGDQKSAVKMKSNTWGPLSIQEARAKHVLCSQRIATHLEAINEPRNLVLAINGRVGALCDRFRWRTSNECSLHLGGFTSEQRDGVARELGSAVAMLLVLADQCNIDLAMATQLKIKLNAEKYPANLVKGSARKYDAYKEHTGFDKGCKQVTTDGADGDDHLLGNEGRPWTVHTFEGLRKQLGEFAKDRGWEKFHTPRNICLALSGEAGELCELFQFKEEGNCAKGLRGWNRDAKDKLAQELSDVCIYLCRLSDVCGLDLTKTLEDNQLLSHCGRCKGVETTSPLRIACDGAIILPGMYLRVQHIGERLSGFLEGKVFAVLLAESVGLNAP